jgi:tetratricopeptide (TPR) repeat protein
VCVAYAGGAWFAIEAIPNVVGYLGVDAGAAQRVGSAVTILAIAAFPMALLLSWMFQVVPDAKAPPEADAPPRRRRLITALSVVLVSSGCIGLAAVLWPPASAAAPRSLWASRPVVQAGVALMPPVILTEDAETRRVARSLVHRLTDRLASSPDLVVRAPSQTEAIAATGAPTDSLASMLGVETLIPSTAERWRDTFRITFRILEGRPERQVSSISAVGVVPSGDETFEALTDSLETKLREALGRIGPGSLLDSPVQDSSALLLLRQAQDELTLYRRHLGARDVDGAIRSLDRADSLLGAAANRDRAWPEPLIERSRVARDRSIVLLTNDRPAALRSLGRSREYATAALARSPDHPEALALRGLSAYELATIDTSAGVDREGLLAHAEADLRSAQAHHRNRAEVRYHLALVQRAQGRLDDALTVAEDAYEHDAYLSESNELLGELFDLSFQLSRDGEARRWCDEGGRRFPSESTYRVCLLMLMGWGGAPPDTAMARGLVDAALTDTPRPFRGPFRPHLEALTAAVHAQAGDTAGARTILELTSLGARGFVHVTAAGVWLLLGERDAALAELRRYVAEFPGVAGSLDRQRILAPLAGDPRFEALVAAPTR